MAFREWLAPGDRLLLSPVNDDVVLFTVLAAGLVPVIGPIDPGTGNLDPEAIDEATWSSLKGVLTTNLYGIPDRMDLLEDRCRRYGLILIEDAAHALDSRFDGRRIGSFGHAAVFSFSKHLEVPGGVLAFPDASRGDALARSARDAGPSRLPLAIRVHRWLAFLKALLPDLRVPAWGAPLVNRVVPRPDRGNRHRMPYAEADVLRARTEGGLEAFDRWVRMDLPTYRVPPLRSVVRASLNRLQTFEEDRRLRIEGVRKLLDLGLTPAQIRVPQDLALLRVPLFVEDREHVISELARRGLTTEYVYDPPLDLYAARLIESRPSPPAARTWSHDVLPVNPRNADRFLAIVGGNPGLLRPIRHVA